MPIIPMAIAPLKEESDITLSLYAQVIGIPEWLMFGVKRDNDTVGGCVDCWDKYTRDTIKRYLAEAQVEIEQRTEFPLVRRWISGELRPYSYPVASLWKRVYDAGVRATSTIRAGATVTHVVDDANGNPVASTVTVATTVTDENEIKVYYPASLGVEGPVEIDPSDIDISGGIATIYIPRWRMVLPGLLNSSRCLDYDTTTNFLTTVDVTRVYHDSSEQGTLIWPHANSSCGYTTCCVTCGDYTHDACMYPKNQELGFWDVIPATYSGGSWLTNLSCLCTKPIIVELNYRAGPATLSHQARDAVIRLAHSKMPSTPCACEVQQVAWTRDRVTPEAVTRERINCPFGLSDGAWTAWEFASAMRVIRGSVI